MVTLILRRHGKYQAAREVQLHSRLGSTRCHTSWSVVELWTLPAEELLAANDVGLIPWVPLTNFAGPPERLLQRCRECIDQQALPQERQNLLAVTQVMTQLRYTAPGLLSFLGGRQVMIESPLIQELLAKDRAETKQKVILRVLRGRLGPVPEELAAALEGIVDQAQLDELVDRAATCPDLAAFRARLVSATRPSGARKQRKRGR